MTKTLRSIKDLTKARLLPAGDQRLHAVAEKYAVAVTSDLADLIETADDAIARQFIPDVRELDLSPQELADPIGDEAHSPVEGIVHRYPDRVLLKLLHVCPAYCRFCFRREKVGKEDKMLGEDALEKAIDYITSDKKIWEIVFTGGDPLLLSSRRIRDVVMRFDQIPHVKILRWHTRVPVVSPKLVTDKLVAALKAGTKTVYVAVHANHVQEFSESACAAISKLADAGIPLISQSVLLKDINDNPQALEALMRRFVELRIKPYYLHHPDLASGTSHFRVPIAQGQQLAASLRQRASGLCQPHYMLDIPGGHSKVPLAAAYITADEKHYIVRDIWGKTHRYSDLT
ncbi:MAG: lysine-2,3-aminomutase-like protein [Pseudomonadota bacterium]